MWCTSIYTITFKLKEPYAKDKYFLDMLINRYFITK